MSILSILATISGVGMAVSNLPQSFKIFKTKSAKDISPITYLILFVAGFIWILYGLEIQSFPVTFANSIGVLFSLSVLVGWFRYGRVVD